MSFYYKTYQNTVVNQAMSHESSSVLSKFGQEFIHFNDTHICVLDRYTVPSIVCITFHINCNKQLRLILHLCTPAFNQPNCSIACFTILLYTSHIAQEYLYDNQSSVPLTSIPIKKNHSAPVNL
jgi:hypothetical protein